LTELLEKDYLVSPQVSVIIKGYGQIYVVGEVNEPGPYPMQPNMTLMTALALAGGITDSAQDLVRVIRQADGIQELIDIPLSDIRDKGLVEKDIKLRPHDVIQVGRSVKGEKETYVYILGQVNKPGEYLFKDKLTVVEAVTLAGGLTKIAAPNRTRVIRVESGSKKAIKVNIGKILKGDKKRDIVLQPDDVVMVPESFF
jgi:polysaccharide export outer membrane protein